MKKLMIAASAALCAAVGFCDVTSANIVGYVTQDIPAGKYVLIGCPFEATTGANLDIQDFIKGDITPQYYPDYEDHGCATIQVPRSTGTGYDIYTYIWADGEVDSPVFEWWDESPDKATLEIKPGFSCWFKNPTACTITVAGQIAGTDKDSITLPENRYVLVANPFPMDVKLNSDNIDSTGLTPQYYPDYEDHGCATIQIPRSTGSGYDIYTYIWADGEVDSPVFEWWDESPDKTDVTIKAFTGFWMKDPKGGTIKFVK